ncbi:hypothetical protein GLOTRDRAFT_63378 [Gloeophyllum trabeum ATCC 11539]|uniref:Phosphatidic acid phosphatase type 2/haloperoxidase domain-containing protein n=1 Tax=Gloeophyllum trabeum (strain ATCC 11539 / FP-39264 / Madison 617) TaxID=670483 RepID=S7Q2F4_GLOTA|nr:uncharacterized protein GLOTRDRAFT_63378 [Gloeophyllum trabeum ATCC 11539]EPQ53728.1 hypothetical protein GLOTRDRAFT_63378 [Gloeophyllum trabeum ATCC 11539]
MTQTMDDRTLYLNALNNSQGMGRDDIKTGLTADSYRPPKVIILDDSPAIMNGEDKTRFTRSSPGTPSSDDGMISLDVGRLPGEVYDNSLMRWAAALRRRVVKRVEWESEVIAAMQERIRTPWLDTYFVYTSSLGTHTFFMTALPCAYFFGYPEIGGGLLFVLSTGVYVSSVLKDAVCSPRPYAPPVTRLTMGSHHLEYGFPSTHTTNSVSIALFIFTHVYRAYMNASMSQTAYIAWMVGLIFYTFSIVYGRIYTAMHSFTDCAMGIMLGTSLWLFQLFCQKAIEDWIVGSAWLGPITVCIFTALIVNQHPQPVDDCPCFEDAIAFMSVNAGAMLCLWHRTRYGFDESYFVKFQPGSAYETWTDVGTWWLFAAIKVVVGVLLIFMWRLIAKSLMHLILPPIYRLLAQAFTLPNRRFYTPATDYDMVPPEKSLRPIPSVIDLPAHMEMEMEMKVDATGAGARLHVPRDIKLRNTNGSARREKSLGRSYSEEEKCVNGNDAGMRDDEKIKHYDADVLTKVIVYSGIAILATEVVPILFEILGWGTRSH